MAFALFAIAILWPLQRALQKRIPSGLALIVTILLALVIVVKLISLVAWGGGQIAQWFVDNVDRLNLLYAETAKRLEAHDIFVPAIIADRFDTTWLLRALQQVAARLNGLLGFLVLTFIFWPWAFSRSRLSPIICGRSARNQRRAAGIGRRTDRQETAALHADAHLGQSGDRPRRLGFRPQHRA